MTKRESAARGRGASKAGRRYQLPRSVRGGMWHNLDRRLALVFLASLVINGSFVAYLHAMELPEPVEPLAAVYELTGSLPRVVPPRVLDPARLQQLGERPVQREQRSDAQATPASRRRRRPCAARCQQARARAHRAHLLRVARRSGVLALLGHRARGGGVAANLLERGQVTRNALENLSGLKLASTAGARSLRGLGSSQPGPAAGIGSLAGRVSGPRVVHTGGAVRERVPRALVRRQAPRIEGGSEQDGVGVTLRRGLAAVRSCYQRALKRDPRLAGKLTLRIDIDPMGRVSQLSVERDALGDAQVVRCIEAYARRWRFPPPRSGVAHATVPLVFKSVW